MLDIPREFMAWQSIWKTSPNIAPVYSMLNGGVTRIVCESSYLPELTMEASMMLIKRNNERVDCRREQCEKKPSMIRTAQARYSI